LWNEQSRERNQNGSELLREYTRDNSFYSGMPRVWRVCKPVELLTLKSMLLPESLAELDVHQTYRFCTSSNCHVVYFGDKNARFITEDLWIPVFQKDPGEDVNVCYCFGWTRAKVGEEIRNTGKSTVAPSISAHIKAGRCACEVNNPQGSCCLGNVAAVFKEAKQKIQ
jgi:hypothetical protein